MKEKIANRQFAFILILIRSTIVIAHLPVLTSADAFQDAWVSALLSLVGSLVLVAFIAGLSARFPDRTLVEYSRDILGPVLGSLVSLIPLWAFLHLAAMDLRLYAEILVVGFLPETPLAFMVGSMALVAAYCAYGGVEVLGRTADAIFFLFILFVFASVGFAVPQMNVEHLQPVLARGMLPPIRGAITPLATSAQFLVLTFLFPNLNQPEKGFRSALFAMLVSSIILVVTAMAVVGVMSAPLGAESAFPFFQMVRVTRVSQFLERVEAPTVVAWGFGLFITLSAFLLAGSRGVAQLVGIQDYRPLVMPMAVVWVVLSLHVQENIFQVRGFQAPQVFGPYGLALIFIPMSILWVGYGIRRLLSWIGKAGT